ncbi:hypothetical protein DSO57_1016044 [Entomophthora muscae]|uniref:Uncharacterized protein n=1 Tax=Entomophthora muscae TaxID=34485 RepID=A0ACC2UER1_9FUNG|nr:hypothetical protein DSO57_1016044 [Entomophthora muscae]
MVPVAGPWALVGQSASYLIKLAPLLWWSLPSSQQSKLAAEANRPFPGMWYHDKNHISYLELWEGSATNLIWSRDIYKGFNVNYAID